MSNRTTEGIERRKQILADRKATGVSRQFVYRALNGIREGLVRTGTDPAALAFVDGLGRDARWAR